MTITKKQADKIRSTYRWAKLSKQVIREEPACWLRLPGCTGRSTTADHIIPITHAPHLAYLRSNTRGACRKCNDVRRDTPINQLAELRAQLMTTPQQRQARARRHIAAKRSKAPALAIFG